ncbi:DUF2239 family protein [Oxalobacteraceae bacterium CAVE-383]|nr:DUF2239 family protein [Oxalobacteraceae bacterium CAVE-383]
MKDPLSHRATAFGGHALLCAGSLLEVALAIKAAEAKKSTETILAFDDQTGRVIDFDLRGSRADVIERLLRRAVEAQLEKIAGDDEAPSPASDTEASGAQRGRGRPKLGVVAREVTLLPRHWEWLAAQTGGASVTLRRLVEQARRGDIAGGKQQRRQAQEAAYHFMSALAGDLPGFEEACRALFADDGAQFRQHIGKWPADVAAYATRLADIA